MPPQPFPTGTTHELNNEGMRFLPPFVQARLEYLADMLQWRSDEGQAHHFTSYEVKGRLSNGYYTAGKQVSSLIQFWIASDDECNRSLYIAGSGCWICPDSHYLFFDAIDPDLLPEKPDPSVWWCINYKGDIKVIKIQVTPEEESLADFPDGV
jgi:hypothetical protein